MAYFSFEPFDRLERDALPVPRQPPVGRPQGPAHRILSPLAPTIRRSGEASPVYRRGRGGCGRGDGALVAARPFPLPHLFPLFSWNCATNFIVHGAPN